MTQCRDVLISEIDFANSLQIRSIRPGELELHHPVVREIMGDAIVSRLSASLVEQYMEAYQRGEIKTPVVLFWDGKLYWIGDGFHRIAASIALGYHYIEAEIEPNSIKEDAEKFALGANERHGLRRTNAEKRAAVEYALAHPVFSKYGQSAIARLCCVSDTVVRRCVFPERYSKKEEEAEEVRLNSEGAPYEPTAPVSSLLGSEARREPLAAMKPDPLPVPRGGDKIPQDTKTAPLDYDHDAWCTPLSVLSLVGQLGPIGLDPCSNSSSRVKARQEFYLKDDGLSKTWRVERDEVIFVNPPWSSPLQWIEKCIEASYAPPRPPVVALVRMGLSRATSIALGTASILIVPERRIAYHPPVGYTGDGVPNIDSWLYLWNVPFSVALRIFGSLGAVINLEARGDVVK